MTLTPTTTALTSSVTSGISGASITLTATISPAVPDGETVTFLAGTATVGTATTSGSVATLTTTALPVGNDTVTASYPGDATYYAAVSNAVFVNVMAQIVINNAVTMAWTGPDGTAHPNSVWYPSQISFDLGDASATVTFTGYNTAADLQLWFLNGGKISIGQHPYVIPRTAFPTTYAAIMAGSLQIPTAELALMQTQDVPVTTGGVSSYVSFFAGATPTSVTVTVHN